MITVAETGLILLDGYFIDPNDGWVSRGKRTSFNVKGYKNHDNIEVTVSSGKVAVYRSEKPDERVILIKGQKGVFYKTTKKIEVSVN